MQWYFVPRFTVEFNSDQKDLHAARQAVLRSHVFWPSPVLVVVAVVVSRDAMGTAEDATRATVMRVVALMVMQLLDTFR